ncbi:hypothetical protein BDN72DRAFT_903699 [Pluteus cervinus]|uniref:Uncharacterized protein n=1 Tax=Pluteus cervinus TaxID=181527 RepID=A0ACD3A7Q2_9AGAR|nr:hypothetical protein BDN72DRAFT_903699 [Pluteus cervinus]
MAHHRSNSAATISSLTSLTSLTSNSSITSVEIYNNLKPEISAVEGSQSSLQELVEGAEKIIRKKFSSNSKCVYTYGKGATKNSVNLNQIMLAMLDRAEECGGEDGKRYVASTIVACSRNKTDEETVDTLAAVGTTWLTHFLFVFKTSRSCERQPNKELHELTTPTIQTTASSVGQDPGSRSPAMHDKVIKRAGYKCALTGFQDSTNPTLEVGLTRLSLETAHILRRAVVQFNPDNKSDSFKSAVTTFDILKDATYSVFVYQDQGILRKPEGDLITFTDRSGNYTPFSNQPDHKGVALPNPHYLAIHAAIAGVLNMSGAGKFLEEVLDHYKDGGGNLPAVRCFPELEKLMVEEELREILTTTLQSVKVQ